MWALARGVKLFAVTLATLDVLLSEFFTENYLDGCGPGAGRNALFGLILLDGRRWGLNKSTQLPNAQKALAGRGWLAPGQQGLPVPIGTVWMIA